MAETHDHLEVEPVVRKTVVEHVLNGILAAGNGLISLMSGLLATVLIVYSGYVIVDTVAIQERARGTSWDMIQYKPVEDASGDGYGSELEAVNPDYRAWLSIYDTNIDYPVMQGTDDLYYASHDIYGESSLTGAIYLSAINESDFSNSYNIVYGHHLDSNVMFGSLDQFEDEGFFNRHRNGILVTKNEIYDITLFAVVSTDAYESKIYGTTNAQAVMEFLGNPSGGVGVGTTVTRLMDDTDHSKIIALSTCASAVTSGRLVVFGSLMPRAQIGVTADGYTGVYDGKWHGVTNILCNYPADAVIEYSTDGENWSTESPLIRNVGSIHVLVRARTEQHGTAQTEVDLVVKPKPVTVTAVSRIKNKGEADPALSVYITGVLGTDSVQYSLRREPGENAGRYTIYAEGTYMQGNYAVTYVPGLLTILDTAAGEPASSEQSGRTDRIERTTSGTGTGTTATGTGAAESVSNLFVPYVPTPTREVTDFEVPLNVGKVTINVGDGVE